MKIRSAWDLIGHEGKFRLIGGRTVYEAVLFNDATSTSGRPRLARLDVSGEWPRQINRYVDPDTEVEVLEDFDEEDEDNG